MSLHADLLDQARQLAQLDERRPKQASLRRAVSSAYYALFHLLTSEASALYAAEPGLAARINRTLSHGEMKKASSMIANDKLPKAVQAPGGGYLSPADLKTVANAFRHPAAGPPRGGLRPFADASSPGGVGLRAIGAASL